MEQHTASSMTPEQGIRIIETMLSRTQQKLKDNGLLYRVWGYLVFLAALLHYYGIVVLQNQSFGLVWAILMPIGGIATWYITRNEKKEQPVNSYLEDILKSVLTTFFVSLVFSLLFAQAFSTWNVSYAFLLLAYGSWLFISGELLRFRALKIGGIINWLSGAACFFIEGPQCLLVLAFAVLAGYIIPGHLIQKEYRKENG